MSSASHSYYPNIFIHFFDYALVFESSGENVHLETQASQYLRKFEHIDNLPAGIRCSQRRFGCHIAMNRQHRYPSGPSGTLAGVCKSVFFAGFFSVLVLHDILLGIYPW